MRKKEETKMAINHKSKEEVHRMNVGMKYDLIQIHKTVKFEFRKNIKKYFTTTFLSFLIYLLTLAINIASENGGAEAPASPAEYIQSYFTMIDFVIIIIAMNFAGSIIAEDFEKQTGNLLFPKISKERLLIGRIIARYALAILSLLTFYILIAGTTAVKYEESLPSEIWLSFGWASLYLFSIMAFVTFLSSIAKRTSGAMIGSFIILLMVFQLVSTLLMFAGVESEPLYILTYYSGIISACFNMPADRSIIKHFRTRDGSVGDTYLSWITPSVQGAAIGMILYALVFLTIAYLFYKRRQSKSE